MGLLSSEDKVKINRAIPKGSNNILDATVAKLFVAYPDPDKYEDTGVSGAVVLVDDTVGKTFFIKIVDIYGQRGVIWDQELCVNFEYHKDRTFFHSFEMDNFTAGLLFEDTSEANHFFKRVSSKEKYGSKQTVQHISSAAQRNKDKLNQQQTQTAGPRGFNIDVNDPNNAQKIRRAKNIMYYNDVPPPEWKDLYEKLQREEGINEWDISENKAYIKEYVQNHGYTNLVGLEPPIPRKYQYGKSHTTETASVLPTIHTSKKKAPPPPPPAAAEASSTAASPEPISASADASITINDSSLSKHRVPPAPSFLGSHYQQQSTSPATSAYQQAQNQNQTASSSGNTLPPLPLKVPSSLPLASTTPQSSILNQFSRGAVDQNNNGIPHGPLIPLRIGSTVGHSSPMNSRLVPPLPPMNRSSGGLQPPLPPSRNSAGLTAPPPPPARLPGGLSPARLSGGPPPPPPARRGGAPPPLPPTRKLPTPPQQISSQPQQYQQNNFASSLPPQQFATSNNAMNSRYTQPLALPHKQQSTAPAMPPIPPPIPNLPVALPGPPAPPAPPGHSLINGSTPSRPIPAMFGAPAPPDFGHRSEEPSMPTAPAAGSDGRDALMSSIRNSGIGKLKKIDKTQIKHF